MSTFDDTGYTIDRYDEVRERIADALRAAFGAAIAVDDEDSVVGKLVTIMAEAIADLNEDLELAVASFDPDNASGTALKKLVKLNGLTANESLFSTASVTLTANVLGSTVPEGSKVNDPNTPEVTWSTDSEVVLAPSGSDSVSVTCDTAGAIEAPAGTLTEITTPVSGWSTVNNSSAATVGQDEETSAELRRRRDLSSQSYGLSTLSGVWRALADLDNVDEVYVQQNLGTITDEFGVPARNLRAIISGGSDPDIAETLFKTAPLQTFGGDSDTYTFLDNTYTLYFDRPTDTDITIEITYAPITAVNPAQWPSDGDQQIKDALVAWGAENHKMGVDAIPSYIQAGVGNTIEGFYSTAVLVDGGSVTVSADIGERLVISDANITVNVL